MGVNNDQVNDTPQGEVTPTGGPDQNPNQAPQLPGWFAGATAEQKEKYGTRVTEHAKMPSFLDAAFTAMDKLDRAVVRPGEDATEEEVAAFREAMGIPADSNSYELTTEQGSGTEAFIEGIKEMAFNNNLSTAQAQAMVDLFVNSEKEAMEKLDVELKNQIEKGMNELQKEMGTSFEPKMLKAQRMVGQYFGTEFADYLKESQMGNDPRFIRGMIGLSELISEDNLDMPPGGKPKDTGGWNFPNTPGME